MFMKRSKILLVLALVLLLALSISGQAFAQKFTYQSGFQVQNLENQAATVVITYYKQDGTVDGSSVNDTIPASGSKTYFPISASSGFNGSVVISSDREIGSVVNILGSGGSNAAASYVGSSAGNTSVQIPLLMKGNSGFDTWYNLQNTGSATANVTVAYSDGTSATGTIAPGASKTFFQANETHPVKVFSAVVTSDQPVAAAVVEESSTVMFAYSGFNAGSTNPVMPLINANNAGYITGAQILNGGTQSTNVTVSYTPSAAGTACTETQTIAAGQSATFALGAFGTGANSTCAAGERFVGSARVTTNSTSQPLTAIVNQLLPGVNGEAYGAFDPTAATDTVVMPLIMDRNGSFFTGFNLLNVGSSASVNCTFSGNSFTISTTLGANAATTQIQNGQIAAGYVGSATCAAGSGGLLLAVVNEVSTAAGDNFLVYEGISQ
jgi:hypothetical protein